MSNERAGRREKWRPRRTGGGGAHAAAKVFACAALLATGALGAGREAAPWPQAQQLAAAATPAAASPTAASAAAAATSGQTPVRVALFIESGRYSATTPAAALEADRGLTLAIREAGGLRPAAAAGPGEAVRVYADGYYAELLQSADAAAVQAAAEALAAAEGGAAVGIWQRAQQGKPLYVLFSGPFPAKEQAAAAAAKHKGAAVRGPLRYSAGSYADEAQAAAQAAALEAAGYPAGVAHMSGGGYAALVGNEPDEAALAALKAKLAAALPAVKVAALESGQSYVLKQSGAVTGVDGKLKSIAAYTISGEAKLWVEPADPTDGVRVKERSGRSYRGGIEVTTLNGKLAVINELPLETYVESVLGSELSAGWPIEALKAQAVAARTYILKQKPDKYSIASVSDTTTDQMYKGIEGEFAAARQAVEATKGEVLRYNGALIEPLYYSNAGGMTADPTEVWGNPLPYLKPVPSPDDGAQAGKLKWLHVVLPTGVLGYIRSDLTHKTNEQNAFGIPYYESAQDGVNVRSAPYVSDVTNPAIAKVNRNDRFLVIGDMMESNAFSWIRGPYSAEQLRERMAGSLPAASATASLDKLEVTKRGPSGRVMEVSVNGQPVKTTYPDSLRTLLGGLPSTRFEIEQTGRYTIWGANGSTRDQSEASKPLYAVSASGAVTEMKGEHFFVLSAGNSVTPVSRKPQFLFKGTGFGHGLGMSQWGAKGYAELGYSYAKILEAYYPGAQLSKQ
ncbi:SpoIID/LytB domain-containing protein [Paenibacillus sp. YYML68]|uniref:SpoIID/LytB domain-containing protein n=1 Tax=Paenibacillus sp. YYML68 TaxID=2909250 RepID=UPI0024912983|nr:SpoIID/LytB domain-containing protein [Paenibacillus sp. YYML68]